MSDDRWTWKMLLAAMLVAACTWVGLNVGKMLYQDWSFLHTIRLATEAQQGKK